MELQPDTLLHDRYRIVEKLGQGGMGEVYLAWDEVLKTRVAVKINFNPAPESVTQFLKEAQLLAGLRHQNLPRVTDYFVIDKEQYLVMDFIPGDDLGQLMKRGGSQKIEDVLDWAKQLNLTLSYMHNQDPPVTHRDIKPANIKVTADGKAILVDFGIAKVDSVQAHTATGATGYTPGYAPPEQYGQERTGPFSDQFSLAATMYALLVGKKPADSIQRLLGEEALIPVREINPQVPVNVGDAILKAMSLEPSKRFDTVSDFQTALDNPNFRLTESVREEMTRAIPRGSSDPTIVVGSQVKTPKKPPKKLPEKIPEKPPQKLPVNAASPKNRQKRNLILAISVGLIGVISCGLCLFLFILPNNLLNFVIAGNQEPTLTVGSSPTEVQQEQATETPQALIEPEITPTPEPTQSPTPEPTATEQLELVGESGMIVFASDRGENGIVQIWTMRVTLDQQGGIRAGSFVQLTFDEGDKDQPVWSPDGSKIAYVAPGTEETGLDIWVMDADGSNQKNITKQPGDEFDPAWAPDGSLIAFTHHYRDDGSRPIYALVLMNPDGRNRERLSVDFVERSPTFSPDMNWLLYVINASSRNYLYFRGAFDDFQTPEKFDIRSLFGEFGEVSSPAWAPSGNQFAYTRHDGTRQNIVLVTYEDVWQSGVRQPTEFVLTNSNADTGAAWSPDALWLAFTSSRDGGDQEIYLMATSGSPQINLTSREGVDRSPHWKPLPMLPD